MGFYEVDLARIHSSGFSDLSLAGGRIVLDALSSAALRSGKIVDLGSGAGEWASMATAAGFDVLGVDISRSMVELARANASSARFVARSLWEFEFETPLVAVTAFGEALNYGAPAVPSQSDLEELFDRVSAALSPGGLLAFDIVVSGAALDYKSWTDTTEYTVLVDVREDKPAETLTRSIVTFMPETAGYRRSDEQHVLRVYDTDQVGQALAEAGMDWSVSGSYGTYQLGPRRAAFLARRRQQSNGRI